MTSANSGRKAGKEDRLLLSLNCLQQVTPGWVAPYEMFGNPAMEAAKLLLETEMGDWEVSHCDLHEAIHMDHFQILEVGLEVGHLVLPVENLSGFHQGKIPRCAV